MPQKAPLDALSPPLPQSSVRCLTAILFTRNLTPGGPDAHFHPSTVERFQADVTQQQVFGNTFATGQPSLALPFSLPQPAALFRGPNQPHCAASRRLVGAIERPSGFRPNPSSGGPQKSGQGNIFIGVFPTTVAMTATAC